MIGAIDKDAEQKIKALTGWLIANGYEEEMEAAIAASSDYPSHWDFIDVFDASFSQLYNEFCESED